MYLQNPRYLVQQHKIVRMYVMPEGRNADAALHRDTDSYIWAYKN
jgi:hypothetical protein